MANFWNIIDVNIITISLKIPFAFVFFWRIPSIVRRFYLFYCLLALRKLQITRTMSNTLWYNFVFFVRECFSNKKPISKMWIYGKLPTKTYISDFRWNIFCIIHCSRETLMILLKIRNHIFRLIIKRILTTLNLEQYWLRLQRFCVLW